MVRRQRREDLVEEGRIRYKALIEFVFMIIGVSMIIMGLMGIVLTIVIYSRFYDDVLLTGLYFYYFYMLGLGVLLFYYRKSIIKEGRRT
jgi:hypothetical protein